MSTKVKTSIANQGGAVSIVITMIITILISLVSIGFARIVLREQRNTLDKQLSTQAFYLAEAGVQDVIKAVQQDGFNGEKTECAPDSEAPDLVLNPQVDPVNPGLEYTCVLISQAPFTLEYGNVEEGFSTIVPIKAVEATDPTTAAKIKRLVVSWQRNDDGQSFSSDNINELKPEAGANSFEGSTPMLRMMLTPMRKTNGNNVRRETLMSDSVTIFGYPKQAASPSLHGSVDYSDFSGIPATLDLSRQGTIVSGECNDANYAGDHPRYCSIEITDSSGLFDPALLQDEVQYMLVLRAMYVEGSEPGEAKVTITAYDDAGQALRLAGTQAMIDVTARAQDVSRRIQVRVPKFTRQRFAEYSIETSQELCKSINGSNPDPCGL